MTKLKIPISVGELIDKITILEIKAFLTDNEHVHKELQELNKIKSTLTQYLLEYEYALKKVNEKLWKVEDKIRQKENAKEFDAEFIELARSVYKLNDERSEIKRKINNVTSSDYKEVKHYSS